MGSITEKFNLYKANPLTDGAETFDIDKMMNNNWDRLDESAVSQDDMADGIAAHNGDTLAHGGMRVDISSIKGRLDKAESDIEQNRELITQALNKATALEGRMARVEDGLFSNITGNPYIASFASLDGIVLTSGVWNAAMQRIEC